MRGSGTGLGSNGRGWPSTSAFRTRTLAAFAASLSTALTPSAAALQRAPLFSRKYRAQAQGHLRNILGKHAARLHQLVDGDTPALPIHGVGIHDIFKLAFRAFRFLTFLRQAIPVFAHNVIDPVALGLRQSQSVGDGILPPSDRRLRLKHRQPDGQDNELQTAPDHSGTGPSAKSSRMGEAARGSMMRVAE